MSSYLTYARQKVLATLIRAVIYFKLGPIHREIARVPDLYPNISITKITIPSRDSNRTISATLYHPDVSSCTPRPVLVNLHGSAFVFTGMHGSDALFCARMASSLGIYVLDADYRKAPEHPFPAAVHDVEDALSYIATQPEQFDAARVAVSGFSAGGTLALIAAGALRAQVAEKGVLIQAVAAMYPATDKSIPNEGKSVSKPINPMAPRMRNFLDGCYLPETQSRTDLLVSPAYAPADAFPRTVLILTAEGDELSTEAEVLARNLEVGERKTVYKCFENMWHGFDKGAEDGTEAAKCRDEAYSLIGKGLRDALLS